MLLLKYRLKRAELWMPAIKQINCFEVPIISIDTGHRICKNLMVLSFVVPRSGRFLGERTDKDMTYWEQRKMILKHLNLDNRYNSRRKINYYWTKWTNKNSYKASLVTLVMIGKRPVLLPTSQKRSKLEEKERIEITSCGERTGRFHVGTIEKTTVQESEIR